MDTPITVVLDACVLYSAPLRDLMIRLAQASLIQARWTAEIHEEWTRNVLTNNPNITRVISDNHFSRRIDSRFFLPKLSCCLTRILPTSGGAG